MGYFFTLHFKMQKTQDLSFGICFLISGSRVIRSNTDDTKERMMNIFLFDFI
jgi:hypothetical protein